MDKRIRYSSVALILMLQAAHGTSSWNFFNKNQSDQTKDVKKEAPQTKQIPKPVESTKMETKIQDDVQAFINQHEKTVVMFSLSSCGFCKYLEPIFKSLEKEYSSSVHFKIVLVNGKKEYYKNLFKFSTFPTVIYFAKGQEKARHGSDNKRMTLEKMRGYIKSSFIL